MAEDSGMMIPGLNPALAPLNQRELPKIDTSAENGPDAKKLKEQCAEFESIFLYYLMQSMRQSSKMGDGLFGSSFAEDTYKDMLDEELTKEAAKSGKFGLGELLYRQLSGR